MGPVSDLERHLPSDWWRTLFNSLYLETDGDVVACRCEEVTVGQIRRAARLGAAGPNQLKAFTRCGMGPCQGGFCMYRATGILHDTKHLSATEADRALLAFLEERWKGSYPLLHGDQLRQAWLDNWIFQGVLDAAHLPPTAPARREETATGPAR